MFAHVNIGCRIVKIETKFFCGNQRYLKNHTFFFLESMYTNSTRELETT